MKRKGKAQQLIAELAAFSEENDRLAEFAKDGCAVAEFVQDATKAISRRISDAEITELMLKLEPGLDRIEITEEFSETELVLLCKGGQSFQGAIVGLREGAVLVRLRDNSIVHVLKNSVVALRRP